MKTYITAVEKERILTDIESSIATAIRGATLIGDDLLSYLLQMACEQLNNHTFEFEEKKE